MPYVQTSLDSETFKEVKKDAIDKAITLGDYVKEAVVERLRSGKVEGKETTNGTNLTEEKEN